MPKWYPAKSIKKLRDQVDSAFPNRDTVSDGVVGDTSHKARKSSHNPDKQGAVRATDITHNPEKGVDGNMLLNALLKGRDKRLWYLIFNKQIYNVKDGFQPRPYNGLNAHKHHVHISVLDDPKMYDNDADWDLDFSQEIQPRAKDEVVKATAKPKPITDVARGAKGEAVKEIQQALVEQGFLQQFQVDSDFGATTQKAVQHFQLAKGLGADGIVGKKTREALGLK